MQTWIKDQFFTFLIIERSAYDTIYCHSPGGNTATSYGILYGTVKPIIFAALKFGSSVY